MAEIIKVKERYQIQLTLQKDFINKYGFQKLVQHPDTDAYFIDYSSPGSFSFPFTFPPFHVRDYDEAFLTTFLQLMRQLLLSYSIDPDIHLDSLLFITNSYQHSKEERQRETYRKNHFHVKGKLLVELLRMPIDEITRDNIMLHLPEWDGEEYLKAYLGVLSGKPETMFQSDGKVDLSLVNDNLFQKLVDRITEDNNIVIDLEDRKRLVFSKDITLKFQSGLSPKVATAKSESHNTLLVTHLLQNLIDEEKANNTELYSIISRQSFDRNDKDQKKKLTKAVFDYDYFSHHAILKRIAILFSTYLQGEGLILKPKKKGKISFEQKSFLYPLFLLLGFIPRNDKQIHPFKTSLDLQLAMSDYEANKLTKAKFYTNKLTEAFR